jgi:hypothetical protein
MPTQVDTPSGTGSYNQWGLWGPGAANKVQAVSSNDGDTSVVYAASGGREVIDQYNFPLLAAVTDPVASASITARTKMHLLGGGGRSYYMRWNNTQVGSNRQVEVRWAPGYINISYSAAGAELALAAVNGQHGMKFSAAGGPSNKAEFWVTHLYRTVTFTYGTSDAGEFAHLVGSIAGAAIGSGLLFREMPALGRYIWERGRVLIHPHEHELAWRAWRG